MNQLTEGSPKNNSFMKTNCVPLQWYGALLALAASTAAVAQQPTIYSQPQSQQQTLGSNVTLSVTAFGEGPASPALPSVGSGTLRLWLKADAGVVTNAQGNVTVWHDQSGNANDAAQTATNQQPAFKSVVPSLNGRPTIRFNGIQDNVNGDMLQGTNDVGVPDAMTSFVVYNAFSTANFENILWMVGIPAAAFGGDRSDYISSGDMAFTTWGYVYIPPYVTPVNTYRIKSDRITTNLSSVEMSDISATGSNTNISASLSTTVPPTPGYFVGGLNINYPYVGSDRTFDGDIAELIIYRGYLTDSDQSAVTTYLQQKYYALGSSSGLTYQWVFDYTNVLSGETNATLSLSDVQTNEAGTYTVLVTDSDGTSISSNAVVTVGVLPSITSQPGSLDLAQGSTAVFTAGAAGTAPLNYQWYLGSAPISLATNSTLTISNVQGYNAGAYSVTITSPYGSVASSNAVLTVEVLPVISGQPQSQAANVGSSVTLSVSTSPLSLPPVASGNLRLWLAADNGVVADSSGKVSVWKDQSGNANDAVQTATNQQPLLVTGISGLSGRPALRFNGVQDNVNGDMLHGSGDVGTPNAVTSFVVYNAFAVNYENVLYLTGVSGNGYGDNRVCYISSGDMAFSSWGYVYLSPFTVPLNTYRVRTDLMDTNGDEIDLFDASSSSSTNFSFALSGTSQPSPGYDIGGVNPHIGSTAHDRTFNGDIAEVIIYRGYLSDSDRLAVANYLEEKYYHDAVAETNDLTFQWQYDGTNIAGATNSSLTLTNVQLGIAGTYSVIVSNSVGAITSSNAIVSVGNGPSFTVAPLSQSAAAGSSLTFSATVSGSTPISYQWSFNGTSIPNATNSSFTVSTVTTNSGGAYQLTASNPFGTASGAANLSVLVPTLQAGSATVSGGDVVTVPVQLIAVGSEAGLGFSLNFDPAKLTFTGAVLGSNALGSLLLVNTNQISSGHLGIAIDLTSTPTVGTNEVAEVTFQVAVLTNATTTAISFGGQPTPQEISDGFGNPLLAVYLPGTVSISKAVLEGDVWPVPTGDGLVTISDWVEEGRLVAGLDDVTNAGELQRADCAPRSTGGDGELTVADWVQVGRYAAALDPLTALGYPPNETSVRRAPIKTGAPRPIAIVPMSFGGLTNSVAVQLTAQGGENSIGFSISFDPAAVRFVNATLGSGATGAVLFQNTAQKADGQLGFVLGYNLQGAPTSFSAGIQQVIRLSFASVSYSNNVALNFGNTPVICDVVDVNADSLAATYKNVLLPIGGASWPELGFNQGGDHVSLSWPISATSGFVLESAASVSGPWIPVTTVLTTNNGNVNFSSVPSGAQTFFRLQHN